MNYISGEPPSPRGEEIVLLLSRILPNKSEGILKLDLHHFANPNNIPDLGHSHNTW